MIWSGIFWYTSILLLLSIMGRGFDIANTTWQQHSISWRLQDLFDVFLPCIGLPGLFGMAFQELYLDQAFWQGYFVFSMAYLLTLFWTPKFAEMRRLYGNVRVFKAIAANTLLMVPAHIAQFYYAFVFKWHS